MRRRVSLLVALVVAAVACSEQPDGSVGPVEAVTGRPSSDPALSVAFRDAQTDNVTSDGRFGGAYTNGQCGVSATFNLLDLRLATQQNPITGKDKAACGDPRSIELAFHDPDGLPDGTSNFLNVDHVQTVTADSGTVERHAQFNGTCSRVVFNPDEFSATSRVLVTRVAADTWTVEAPQTATAYCVGRGKLYVLPFQITIKLLP
jgi:hypothetical protein